jgi:hypothetical protein
MYLYMITMASKNFCSFRNTHDGLFQMEFDNGYSLAIYTGEAPESTECDVAVYKNGVNITSAFFPEEDIEDFMQDCEFYDVMEIIIALSAVSNEDIRECMLNNFDPEDMLSLCTEIDAVVSEADE